MIIIKTSANPDFDDRYHEGIAAFCAMARSVDGNGTPLGVQLIGPMHEDSFVLDVAARLEGELGMIWAVLAEKIVH